MACSGPGLRHLHYACIHATGSTRWRRRRQPAAHSLQVPQTASANINAELETRLFCCLPVPQGSAKFLKQHWEQAPAVFKASAARRALFAGLFSYADLQRLAVICEQEEEPLEFGVDVNAARYVEGKRETPNGEVGGGQWLRGQAMCLTCLPAAAAGPWFLCSAARAPSAAARAADCAACVPTPAAGGCRRH